MNIHIKIAGSHDIRRDVQFFVLTRYFFITMYKGHSTHVDMTIDSLCRYSVNYLGSYRNDDIVFVEATLFVPCEAPRFQPRYSVY